MSDDTPNGGDPGHPGGETPAHGPPPPPFPPRGSGYGAQDGSGYQEWPHQAPPGVDPRFRPPQRDPQAVSRGVKAAAWIFAAAVALHLLSLAAVAVSGDGSNGGYFLFEGLFVAFVGLLVAIFVSLKLPLESRSAFWISGVAFMALSFIIWGVTCGLALSVSPVNFH
ncbi:MAG TPA: hypothetical protein VFJ82_06930 [Longimicrobium sp.]|nr:hypothetical protein [Longimicrobium sp.]